MKNLKKIMILMTVVLMTFSWTACSSNTNDENNTNGTDEGAATETTYPLTITDDLGNEITFDKAPEKIVSVAPSNTEILFALGLGDKVIGRDEYSLYPAETASVEVVGGYSGPNTEKIIELAPDVIFSSFSSIPDDVRQLFEASNIKIVVFNPVTIDDILKNIEVVGSIANVQPKADEIVSNMSTKRKEVVEKVKDVETKKVFIDLGSYYSVGPNSFIGSMLKEINVTNIADDAETDYPQLTLEKIIEADPDVYISTITPAADIKKVVGIESTNAFKNNNIIEFAYGTPEHDMIQQPGPRVIEGLEIYAKSIYPEAFK